MQLAPHAGDEVVEARLKETGQLPLSVAEQKACYRSAAGEALNWMNVDIVLARKAVIMGISDAEADTFDCMAVTHFIPHSGHRI